jgi:putative flippase GtrA
VFYRAPRPIVSITSGRRPAAPVRCRPVAIGERTVRLRAHPTVLRLGRFALSGIAVQAVYTLAMALALLALDLPRQAALLVAYGLALMVHFTLNRQFVFAREGGYGLALSAQGGRYLVVAVVVYAVTAVGIAVLPGVLGVATFVVWLLLTGTIGVLNFLLLGRLVFN